MNKRENNIIDCYFLHRVYSRNRFEMVEKLKELQIFYRVNNQKPFFETSFHKKKCSEYATLRYKIRFNDQFHL